MMGDKLTNFFNRSPLRTESYVPQSATLLLRHASLGDESEDDAGGPARWKRCQCHKGVARLGKWFPQKTKKTGSRDLGIFISRMGASAVPRANTCRLPQRA